MLRKKKGVCALNMRVCGQLLYHKLDSIKNLQYQFKISNKHEFCQFRKTHAFSIVKFYQRPKVKEFEIREVE